MALTAIKPVNKQRMIGLNYVIMSKMSIDDVITVRGNGHEKSWLFYLYETF